MFALCIFLWLWEVKWRTGTENSPQPLPLLWERERSRSYGWSVSGLGSGPWRTASVAKLVERNASTCSILDPRCSNPHCWGFGSRQDPTRSPPLYAREEHSEAALDCRMWCQCSRMILTASCSALPLEFYDHDAKLCTPLDQNPSY